METDKNCPKRQYKDVRVVESVVSGMERTHKTVITHITGPKRLGYFTVVG